MDWSTFKNSTQPSEIKFQSDVWLSPFNEESFIIQNKFHLFLFKTASETLIQLATKEKYAWSEPMGFPSLKKIAFIRTDEQEKKRLVVFDAESGHMVFASEPLAGLFHPCSFNPKDEAYGILLCAFQRPTDQNPDEAQAAMSSLS